MIQVTDREIIGAIHMHHWLKPSQGGPLLNEMLDSVIMFYPETDELVVDTPGGESYEMDVSNQELKSRIISRGEVDSGMRFPLGSTRWIQYYDGEDSLESLAMYIGDGKWLTEGSEYVWFYNISNLWEVDVEISQSQS